MDTTRATIPQILSAVAVGLSLIFVGLEIRQNTAAQRAETRQALTDASRELSLAISSSRELTRVWYARWHPELDDGRLGALLTRPDSLQALSIMHANLLNLENVFLQALEGVVDLSVLGTYGFTSPMFENPGFTSFWEARRSLYDPRFVEAFEEANVLK